MKDIKEVNQTNSKNGHLQLIPTCYLCVTVFTITFLTLPSWEDCSSEKEQIKIEKITNSKGLKWVLHTTSVIQQGDAQWS